MGDGSWRSGHGKRLNSQGCRKPLQQNQNHPSRPSTASRQSQQHRISTPSSFLQNQSNLNFDFDPINEHYGRSLNTSSGFPINIFTPPGYPPPPTAYATPFCHALGKRPFSPPFGFEVESSTPNQGQDQVDHDLNPIETGYQGCQGHHSQRMRQMPQNFLSPPSRAHCGCCAGQSAIICLPRSGCPCPPAATSDISNNGNESSRPISQPLADILEKSASFNNCNFYCSGFSEPPTPQGHSRCSPPAKFACSNPKQTPDDYYADPGEIIYSDYFKYGMNYVNQGKESKLKSRKVGVGRSIYKILKKKTQKFCTVDVGVGEIKTATALCDNYYHPWDVPSCYTCKSNRTVVNSNRNKISSAQKENNKDSCIHPEIYNPLISRQGMEWKRLPRGTMHRNKIEEYKRATATPYSYSGNIGMPQTVRENYTINNSDEFSYRGENSNSTTDSKFKLDKPVPNLTTATSVTQMLAVNAFVVKSRSRRFKLRNGKSRIFPTHPLDLHLVRSNQKISTCDDSPSTVTEPQQQPTGFPGCLNTRIHRSAVYQNQNYEYENQNPRYECTILPPPTAFAAPSPLFQCYHSNFVSNAEESAAGTTNTEETKSVDITTGIEAYSSFEPFLRLVNSNSPSKSAPVKDSNIIIGREPATPGMCISTSKETTKNAGGYNFKGNTINTTFSQEKEPKTEPDIASDSEPDYPPERFDYMSEKNMNVISTLVVSSYTNSSSHFINTVGSSSNSAIKDSSGEESPEEIYTGTSKLSLHIKRSSESNPCYPVFSDENSNSIWGDDHQSLSISDSNFENYSSSKDGKNCIVSPSGHITFSPCQIQPKKRSRTTSTRTSEKREIYVEAQLNGAEVDNGQHQKEGVSMLADHKHGFVHDKEKLVNMNILQQGQHLSDLSRHHGHDYVVMHSFYSPKIKTVVLHKCGEDEKGEIFLVERKGRRKHRVCTSSRTNFNVCPCPKNKTVYLRQVNDSPIIRCLDHDPCPHENKPCQQNQKIESSTGPSYPLHGRILQNQSTSSPNHSLFKNPSNLYRTGNSKTGQSQLSQTSNNNFHRPTFLPFDFSSPGQFCCGPYGAMIPFPNYVPPWSTHYARSCRGSSRVPRSTRPSYYSSCCRDRLPPSRSFIKKRDNDRYSGYYFTSPTPKPSPSQTSRPNTPTLVLVNQSKSNTEANPGVSKRVKIISTPPISMTSSSNVILFSPLPTHNRSSPESELPTPTNSVSSVVVTAVPSVPSTPSSQIPSRDLGSPVRVASASLTHAKQDEDGVKSMVTETSETEAKQELSTDTQTPRPLLEASPSITRSKQDEPGVKPMVTEASETEAKPELSNDTQTPSPIREAFPSITRSKKVEPGVKPMVTEASETEAKPELSTDTQTPSPLKEASPSITRSKQDEPGVKPMVTVVTEASETEAKQELSADTQTQWAKMNVTKPSQTKPPLPLTSLLKTDLPVNNSPIESRDTCPCFSCYQPCDPCYPPLCGTFCPQLCAHPCLHKKRNKKQRHRSNTIDIMVCPRQPNGYQTQQKPAPVLRGDGACCNVKRTRNATNHNLNNGLNQSKKCCADMLQLMFPSMFATHQDQEKISCPSQPVSVLSPSTVYSTATGVSPQMTSECQNKNSTSFQVQLGQICCLKPIVPTAQSQAQPEFTPQMMSQCQSCSIPVGGCPKQKNTRLAAFQPQSHSGCKTINNATNISSSSCSYAKSSLTPKHRGSCKRRVNGGRKHL